MRANKTKLRKRPEPYKKTQRGARHKPSGFSKLVRKVLKQGGLWYAEGYPGHGKSGHMRGYKRGRT